MEEQKKHGTGLSLRFVIVVMFILAAAISVQLLNNMRKTSESYEGLRRATENYIICQDDAYKIRETNSYLGERARNFVISGSIDEIAAFYEELETTRTRDRALEELRSRTSDKQSIMHLELAIQLSSRLTAMQQHAMRLAAEGYGIDLSVCPAGLRDLWLTKAEFSQSPEEQLAAAREQLFSIDYRMLETQLDVRTQLSKTQFMTEMQKKQLEVAGQHDRLLKSQRSLVTALMAVLIFVLIFVLALVVYPVSAMIKGIRAGTPLKDHGSVEIQFLAHAYNHVFHQMQEANKKLSYEAAHDPLTGLYNRSSFELLQKQHRDRGFALLLIDVDKFKHINDSYGHDMGDKVLIRVARVLQDSFREADKVCRIGGDEFCVIMLDAASSVKDTIREKVAAVEKALSTPENGIPPVTLSVGVAFTDAQKDGESLYKNADRALYKVKEGGRNGCEFDC